MMESGVVDNHIRIDLPETYRMVIISDIHGHLGHFRILIDKANLKDDDYLVVLGDFVNKGPDNLALLREMMALSIRPRTYIMNGNHEAFIMSYVKSKKHFSDMMVFLKQDPYQLVLHDMAKEMGYDLYAGAHHEDFRQALLSTYKDEFKFMNERPIVFETDHFIAVHGGYDASFCPIKEEDKFLKYDNYQEKSNKQDKLVIVGHWPSCNLRSHMETNEPYLNKLKNILSIDGGLGVKPSGELNALIIDGKSQEWTYHHIFVNDFKKMTIKAESTLPEEDLIFVNYPDFEIKVLEYGSTMSKCLHLSSQKVFSVFSSLLVQDNDTWYIKKPYINRFFNLKVGDQVVVRQVIEDCVHVKVNHEFGWVLPHQIA